MLERARDIVLEMRETTAAADSVLESGQSLIRVFTPGWLTLLFYDGKHEVDNAAAFRESATREIGVMLEGLRLKGVKSAKLSVTPPVRRPGFLKRVFAS